MCLQCMTDAVDIGVIAPGWYLIKATKDSPMKEWLAGEYGIVRCNDPHFVTKLKWFDDIDSNIDEYSNMSMDFYENSKIDPRSGYDLYQALQMVKYPYQLKRYWVKNMIYGFNERFYTYLAWIAKGNENDN